MKKAGSCNPVEPGHRFGALVVVAKYRTLKSASTSPDSIHTTTTKPYTVAECRCDCGQVAVIRASYLRDGRITACPDCTTKAGHGHAVPAVHRSVKLYSACSTAGLGRAYRTFALVLGGAQLHQHIGQSRIYTASSLDESVLAALDECLTLGYLPEQARASQHTLGRYQAALLRAGVLLSLNEHCTPAALLAMHTEWEKAMHII